MDLSITLFVILIVLLIEWPSPGAYIGGFGGAAQRGGANARR